MIEMNEVLKQKIEKINFESLFNKLGYAYFNKGAYNLNIIGISSKETKNNNTFDDIMVVEYKGAGGIKYQRTFAITTNPGVTSLKNTDNPKGCAILCYGQHRGCWTIGYHKGEYEALVQCKPLWVYRDYNKDDVLDREKKDFGIFGINIHKAGNSSKLVNNWSAGCQVFKTALDFNVFMSLCKKQVNYGLGKTFTYTLIDESTIDKYIEQL